MVTSIRKNLGGLGSASRYSPLMSHWEPSDRRRNSVILAVFSADPQKGQLVVPQTRLSSGVLVLQPSTEVTAAQVYSDSALHRLYSTLPDFC